jgi:hypothetical protein
MKYEVPFYSQYDDVTRDEWKSRACTIVCMKMALEFVAGQSAPSADQLLDEGMYIGAYTKDGWSHHGVALIAHNYGVPAYLEEFKSVKIDLENKKSLPGDFEDSIRDYGILKITQELKKGNLVTVSVLRDLSAGGTFHTVLLVGVEEGQNGEILGFYFHDPDTSKERRIGAFITLSDFLPIWRKFALFIGKKGV